ncbi:hypothetical protein HHL17_30465 [Chitinophaga sp. G-6-1-13]|uniref:Ankyrin repeat domain-containing protein n=1 Tax=Chitinophaga fulva TaxID=2728842 RepID=A0A848GU02_9BACT|nr:ankyrin repeat domain-containing protein [Chitinophaga fulva]NML41547.1 hypothetical protein [Chitinophaga fulva]
MSKKKLDTFKNHLGYDGKKINEEKAWAILEEIGVNVVSDTGETPLIIAAYLGRVETLKRIINEVEDVDFKMPGKIMESALLEACAQRRLESIRLLIEAGAELEQQDKYGLTPLAKIFTNVFSDPIPCAVYLVGQGAKITDRVIKVGSSWNAEKFNAFLGGQDIVPAAVEVSVEKKTLPSLDIAYIHHSVNKGNYFETAKLIWQKLVPKSGQAETVQGELLRAVEKLRDEAQRNGNGNFHENCHGILVAYLRKYLTEESGFEREIIAGIDEDLDKLSSKGRPYTDDDLYDRITNRIVDWCAQQTALISHVKNMALYC